MLEGLPFKGLLVYYSGSIRGVPEDDREFPWQLVQYMKEGGAKVLSEHVAGRTSAEIREIRARNLGKRDREILESPEPWFGVRQVDIEWVDKATHLVALVNGPSHGVGMEIQRALDKPAMGLNRTPILCLIRQELFEADALTWMIRGICRDGCFLKTYTSVDRAKTLIQAFLTGHLE